MSARCTVNRTGGVCGGTLEPRIDGIGRVTMACAWCERREAGRCRECPRPVAGMVGRALRCAEHQRAAIKRQRAQWRERNHEEATRTSRKWAARQYETDPAFKALQLARLKAWRLANPEKFAKQRRRLAIKRGTTGKTTAARKRATAKRQQLPRAAAGPRLCVAGCGTVMHGYARKCAPCKQAATEQARQALASGAFRKSARRAA